MSAGLLVYFRTANLLRKNESYTGNLVKYSKNEPVAVVGLRHVAHSAAVDVLEYLDEVQVRTRQDEPVTAEAVPDEHKFLAEARQADGLLSRRDRSRHEPYDPVNHRSPATMRSSKSFD